MKKERIETFVGKFIDDYGDERNFVMAAISAVLDGDDPCYITDEDGYYEQDLVKGVKIGYSICNPIDEFDEDLGVTIAVGRARKNSEWALLATQPGYINSKVVQAFLEQEANYLAENPERYIAGYKRIR